MVYINYIFYPLIFLLNHIKRVFNLSTISFSKPNTNKENKIFYIPQPNKIKVYINP